MSARCWCSSPTLHKLLQQSSIQPPIRTKTTTSHRAPAGAQSVAEQQRHRPPWRHHARRLPGCGACVANLLLTLHASLHAMCLVPLDTLPIFCNQPALSQPVRTCPDCRTYEIKLQVMAVTPPPPHRLATSRALAADARLEFNARYALAAAQE